MCCPVRNKASFGFHSFPAKPMTKNEAKTPQYLQVSRTISILAFAILAVTTVSGVTTLAALAVAGVIVVVALATCSMRDLQTYTKICQTAGMIFNQNQVKDFELNVKLGECEALPTEHCADTVEWRKKLLAAAQHNIVISGNYCGGDHFVEFLGLVEKKIEACPNIKVVIISSPKFIGSKKEFVEGKGKWKFIRNWRGHWIEKKGKSLSAIQQLSKKYPNNFSLVESPDIWHISPGLKKATNHTKVMAIDYGRYFILGGSGIKDNFAGTGLDNFSKHDFLRQQDSMYQQPAAAAAEDEGFIGRLMPGEFRDMDFVFHSYSGKATAGSQVYKQALLLAHRWEQYNKMMRREKAVVVKAEELGLLTNELTPILEGDSITTQLLKTRIPPKKSIKTRVESFHLSDKKASGVAFEVFASGPEQTQSAFEAQLIEKIEKSKKRIVINHMYFHPTAKVMDALIAAAKRGVTITIISSGIHKRCPTGHRVFGPRNKYNYAYLRNSLPEYQRHRVEIFEFEQNKKGNHKKVIVIDDQVIAGSSNLGYKSLVTTSDHELNFFARSKKFAEQTMEVCRVDIKHSRKITNLRLSPGEYLRASLHRVLAPLIG